MDRIFKLGSASSLVLSPSCKISFFSKVRYRLKTKIFKEMKSAFYKSAFLLVLVLLVLILLVQYSPVSEIQYSFWSFKVIYKKRIIGIPAIPRGVGLFSQPPVLVT